MKHAIAALCLLAWPAAADVPCVAYEKAAENLSSPPYEEQPMMVGETGTKEHPYQIEFWANQATGSWTVIAVTPDGGACFVASGDKLARYKGQKPGRQS